MSSDPHQLKSAGVVWFNNSNTATQIHRFNAANISIFMHLTDIVNGIFTLDINNSFCVHSVSFHKPVVQCIRPFFFIKTINIIFTSNKIKQNSYLYNVSINEWFQISSRVFQTLYVMQLKLVKMNCIFIDNWCTTYKKNFLMSIF